LREAGAERVAPGDVRLRLLVEPGEPAGDDERGDHAVLLRQSGPSPSAAAMQRSANAGHANQKYLSSYCTDRRDSMSPFCSLSSSGRSCSTPRSEPLPRRTRPLPREARSRRPATSVRVSTVRPSLSFLYPLTFPERSTIG